MYLLTWNQEDRLVEASLGGRISALEVQVLGEEMLSVLTQLDGPCEVLLDCAKALPFDVSAFIIMSEVKDRWLEMGVDRIVTVAHEDTDLADHITHRIQQVLEGREEFVREPSIYLLKRRQAQLRLAA